MPELFWANDMLVEIVCPPEPCVLSFTTDIYRAHINEVSSLLLSFIGLCYIKALLHGMTRDIEEFHSDWKIASRTIVLFAHWA